MTLEVVASKSNVVALSIGLVFAGDVTFPEWVQIGEDLAVEYKSCHWRIGDWLNYGERKWGEVYAQALENDGSGFAYQTLANDKYVASRIELSRRKEHLSFTHHAEVAGLEPEQQDEFLDRAEDERLTTRELRQLVRATRTLLPVASLDSGTVVCPTCGQPWKQER